MSPTTFEWGPSLGFTLRRQAEALGTLLVRGTSVVFVVLLLALLVVVVASRLLGRGRQRQTLALGAQASFGVRFFGFLFAACLCASFIFRIAPLVALALLLALSLGGLLSVGLRARAWFSGALLVLRGRIRSGNRIVLTQAQGVVEAYGLFHLRIRTDSGDQVFLPLSALHDQLFSIATPDKTFPVVLSFRLQSEPEVHRLQWAALGCVYRDRRSPVQLERDQHDPLLVQVRFRSWSTEAANRAADFLRRFQAQ